MTESIIKTTIPIIKSSAIDDFISVIVERKISELLGIFVIAVKAIDSVIK